MSENDKSVYNQNKRETVCLYLLFVLISIVVFFVLGRNRGYVFYKDSVVYTADDMYVAFRHGIMPGYYFFVRFIRNIFGERGYLNAIAIIQGVLASISVSCFTLYVRKEFELGFKDTILIFLFSTIPYCYSLPEEIATHAIMTESIAFSCFYIYIILVLKGIFNESFLYTVYSLFCAIIMLLIRKQHVLLVGVSLFILLRIVVKKKISNEKKLTKIIAGGIIAGALILFVSYAFLYPARHFTAFDQVTYSLTSKVIYMSDVDDSEKYVIQDEKEVFELLYGFADKEQMLQKYAQDSSDFKWRHAINGMNYTLRNVWKNVITYCRDKGYSDDRTMYLMKGVLFKQIKIHPLRFLYVTFVPVGQSLISAIFIKPDKIYYLCALICTLLYIMSFVICIRNRKESDKRPYDLYILTMVILILNAVLLNVLFQSLQRYVVYTAGLFYVAVYINILYIMRSTSRKRLGKEYISEVNS